MKCLLILPDWFFPAWDLQLHIYLEVNSLAIGTWGSWLAPCSWDHTIFWLLLSMQERGKCCACVGSVPINKTISHIPTLIKIIAYRSFFFFFFKAKYVFLSVTAVAEVPGRNFFLLFSFNTWLAFLLKSWLRRAQQVNNTVPFLPPSCASRITN